MKSFCALELPFSNCFGQTTPTLPPPPAVNSWTDVKYTQGATDEAPSGTSFCAPAVHCCTHRAWFGHFTSEWVHLLLNYAFSPPLILWFYITNMWFWFPQNKIRNCPWYCCLIAQWCLTLWPLGLQHTRLSCPSTSPRACSNSCPLSQWFHPTISSSVVPFSFCPQSCPASGFFSSESVLRITWPKYWSFSFSISPSNEYWFPLGLTGLISLLSKELSSVFSNTTVQKHQFFGVQLSL